MKEGFLEFCELAKEYKVCDEISPGEKHDRVRMGKVGHHKARILGCSRVGWMKIYFDRFDAYIFEDLGIAYKKVTSGDEKYDFSGNLYPENYRVFLEKVQYKLQR